MKKIIPLEQATDAELQIAARFAGLDENCPPIQRFIEMHPLPPIGRKGIIALLLALRYQKIRIDTTNRIQYPDDLVEFEIAEPLR